MADRRYPIQDGPSVPWEFMAPHEAQARKNHGQTLEGLAERGGLGCAEAWVIIHGLKHMDILHEEHKRKWIELTERVNREWSTKQARAEVLSACIAQVGIAFESTLLHAQDKAFHQIIVNHLLASQPAASDLEEHDRQLQIETYNGARKLWEKDLEALLREERLKVVTRLRHVADGYEQGGHTHRARAFRAIADELIT